MWWKRKNPVFPPLNYQNLNLGGEVVPDEFRTEPIRGYRYWSIVVSEGQLALKSLHAAVIWEAENTAVCIKPKTPAAALPHKGKAPDPECTCGFYAENPDHPLKEWQTQTRGRASASGSISMSGRVIICTMGYKAERVAIESPVVVSAKCQTDCDERPTRIVIPSFSGRSYSAYCDTHVPDHEPDVTVDADVWLKHAVDDLSARYPTVTFISDVLLGEQDG